MNEFVIKNVFILFNKLKIIYSNYYTIFIKLLRNFFFFFTKLVKYPLDKQYYDEIVFL